MSFGMIFSIILIVFFLVVAIIAIKAFLDYRNCSLQALFKQDLQETVDTAWSSKKTENLPFEASLPSAISLVCFLDESEQDKGQHRDLYEELVLYGHGNLYLYPPKNACQGYRVMSIEHINITKITRDHNPYCIENTGKIELTINKGYYDILVDID